ncbi:methyltransferase domain-containing protein [Pseudomonadota bacterium]
MSKWDLKYLKGIPDRVILRRLRYCNYIYHKFKNRREPEYRNPTVSELDGIERDLNKLQIPTNQFKIDLTEFEKFILTSGFPSDYLGGTKSEVYREKLLEHFVAWKFLRLDSDLYTPYVDIAACSSPWAKLLRDIGVEASAIDLKVPAMYLGLDYYRREDATKTSFEDESIGGASLQCAFEMFVGTQDIDLMKELGRILKPGGRVVISPLYMHTHPCFYQSPEYYGEPYGDEGATRYVRYDVIEVPSSRKYSPDTFKDRVWDNAVAFGLLPKLYVLINQSEISERIYLHFVLVLEKSEQVPEYTTDSRDD